MFGEAWTLHIHTWKPKLGLSLRNSIHNDSKWAESLLRRSQHITYKSKSGVLRALQQWFRPFRIIVTPQHSASWDIWDNLQLLRVETSKYPCQILLTGLVISIRWQLWLNTEQYSVNPGLRSGQCPRCPISRIVPAVIPGPTGITNCVYK